jgi:hypothetical protein
LVSDDGVVDDLGWAGGEGSAAGERGVDGPGAAAADLGDVREPGVKCCVVAGGIAARTQMSTSGIVVYRRIRRR